MRVLLLAAMLVAGPALADSMILTRPGGASTAYDGVLAEYQESEAYLAFWTDAAPVHVDTDQLLTTGFDSRAWRIVVVEDRVPSVLRAQCEAHAGADGVALDCYGP